LIHDKGMADKKDKDQDRSLRYLSELSGYKIVSDQPDIRGWKVKDKDGRTVGKVDDLLVHTRSQMVVYVDVEVDPELIDVGHDPFRDQEGDEGVREYINKAGENHLIIPIGMVDILKDPDLVRTDAIDHTTFRNTRRFSKGGTIDRDYERTVYSSYVPDSELGDADDDDTFYERKEFQRREDAERREDTERREDPPLRY
jgi:sporulation protein YlmC with PRC-barrel domain